MEMFVSVGSALLGVLLGGWIAARSARSAERRAAKNDALSDLEELLATASSFSGDSSELKNFDVRLFRLKLLNAGVWRPLVEVLNRTVHVLQYSNFTYTDRGFTDTSELRLVNQIRHPVRWFNRPTSALFRSVASCVRLELEQPTRAWLSRSLVRKRLRSIIAEHQRHNEITHIVGDDPNLFKTYIKIEWPKREPSRPDAEKFRQESEQWLNTIVPKDRLPAWADDKPDG